MDELNRKLAEWAGFQYKECTIDNGPIWSNYVKAMRWYRPNHQIGIDSVSEHSPNFTHSLDACFKWLVPRLLELDWLPCISLIDFEHLWVAELHQDGPENTIWLDSKAETPALALCKAIEKLVDSINVK